MLPFIAHPSLWLAVFMMCVTFSDALARHHLTTGIGGGTFSIASINVTGALIP